MRRILLLLLLVLGLVVSSDVQRGSSATSSTVPSTPLFDHVLLIMMENQNINSTYNCGSQCSPFLTPFADSHGLALNYKRVEDGSLPNYFALTMGQINQNPFPGADCSPHPGDTRKLANGTIISNYCPQNSVNIVDRLESAGLTWKDYQENYPGSGSGSSFYSSGGCYIGYSKYQTGNEDATYYVADHNPFVYYTDIVSSGSRCGRIVSANTQYATPETDDVLLSDLNSDSAPNFMWLTPDECDQMHHICYPYSPTDNTGAIQQGSDYLSQLIPQVLNSVTFQNTRSALFITYDENCAVANPPGCGSTDRLYTVWASQSSQVVKTGFRSNTLYNHYSFLSTLESVWNLAPLTNNDANAMTMLEFFNTPVSGFTVSADPMSVAANTGVAGSSTITVSPVNGFTGTVNLSVGTNSTSLACTLSPTHIASGSGNSTLSCTGSAAGNYLTSVTGINGTLSHVVAVTYHVSDFSISLNPASWNIMLAQGAAGNNTISIALVSGSSRPVNLSCSGLPTNASFSFNPPLGSPPFTSILNISTMTSTPIGNFTITVTGTGGGISRTVFFFLIVNATDPVGGTVLPVEKFTLLKPYAGPILGILSGLVAATLLLRRIRRATPASKRSLSSSTKEDQGD